MDIVKFCKKYNQDQDTIIKYIENIQINNTPAIEGYRLIIISQCPDQLIPEMTQDIKTIIKEMKQVLWVKKEATNKEK